MAHRTRAHWVSDHLCWTGVSGINTHDLLPMPYTDESLAHVTARVRAVSEFLERPVVLENPSSYLEFQQSTWTEWDFLATLARMADCGLLLDVNNVYVSSRNHGFDPHQYLDAIPCGRVVQIHLAGHTDYGTHILDTHSTRVVEEVWSLYAYATRRLGPISTLLEWDEDIPSFPEVHAEARKARHFRAEAAHAAA